MSKSGYIKDYRKELESDIWLMPPLYGRVWQWIKYSVNHKDKGIPQPDGTSFMVKSGQRLTSLRQIAQAVAWQEGLRTITPSAETIARIVKWLESKSMITVSRGERDRSYTLITVVNWAFYQGEDESGVTLTGTAIEHTQEHPQVLNNNEKNEKEIYSSVTAEAVVGKSKLKANKQSISPEARQIVRYLSDALKQRGAREGQFDQRWAFAGFNTAEKLLQSFSVQELEAAIDYLLDHKYHGTGITNMAGIANKILIWQREAPGYSAGPSEMFEDPLARGCK